MIKNVLEKIKHLHIIFTTPLDSIFSTVLRLVLNCYFRAKLSSYRQIKMASLDGAQQLNDPNSNQPVKTTPKEALVMASVLKEMGVNEYEPRVINQMIEFSYRKFFLNIFLNYLSSWCFN